MANIESEEMKQNELEQNVEPSDGAGDDVAKPDQQQSLIAEKETEVKDGEPGLPGGKLDDPQTDVAKDEFSSPGAGAVEGNDVKPSDETKPSEGDDSTSVAPGIKTCRIDIV